MPDQKCGDNDISQRRTKRDSKRTPNFGKGEVETGIHEQAERSCPNKDLRALDCMIKARKHDAAKQGSQRDGIAEPSPRCKIG